MQTPRLLYRFRPLDDHLVDGKQSTADREICALRESYIFAPLFSEMNDPMEAYYEVSGAEDQALNSWLASAGKGIAEVKKMVADQIAKAALVSFARTSNHPPMWAYYASGFSGMCLEFDTSRLKIGNLQNERLCSLTYTRQAPPLPSILAIAGKNALDEVVIPILTRKRAEWSHEGEWRYIVGERGAKHHLDDALRRVFLGPRVNQEHAKRVCEVLKLRSVEVLQGKIEGFGLKFYSVQQPCAEGDCERTGAGHFDPVEFEGVREDVTAFLNVPFEALIDECRRLSRQPNFDKILCCYADKTRGLLQLNADYTLRNGQTFSVLRSYDKRLKSIARS